MANEITINASLHFKKDDTDITMQVSNLQIDVSGSQFIKHRQSVGTSEEALTLGDVATGGWCFAVNRDKTNFVEIRSGTGTVNVVKLKAGEAALFRLSDDASAPFAIADTAAVELEYLLIED